MDEKKVKFELSRVALIFVVLFGLCLLIWTFILGVWVGTKIGGKQAPEEIALEKKVPESPPPLSVNATNATPEVEKAPQANQTTPQVNQTTNQTVAQLKEEKKEEAPKTEVKGPAQAPKHETEAPKKEVPKKVAKATEKPQTPRYEKKEVAHLAEKIKEEKTGKFSIQVGAFSQKEKALNMVEKAKKLGYTAEIKEITSEGKTLYKVLVGRYGDRTTADKAVGEIRNRLGVEKPFVIEMP